MPWTYRRACPRRTSCGSPGRRSGSWGTPGGPGRRTRPGPSPDRGAGFAQRLLEVVPVDGHDDVRPVQGAQQPGRIAEHRIAGRHGDHREIGAEPLHGLLGEVAGTHQERRRAVVPRRHLEGQGVALRQIGDGPRSRRGGSVQRARREVGMPFVAAVQARHDLDGDSVEVQDLAALHHRDLTGVDPERDQQMEGGLRADDPRARGLGDVRHVGDVIPVRVADQNDLGAADVLPDQTGVGPQLRTRLELSVEQAGSEPGDVGVEEHRPTADVDAPAGGAQPPEGSRTGGRGTAMRRGGGGGGVGRGGEQWGRRADRGATQHRTAAERLDAPLRTLYVCVLVHGVRRSGREPLRPRSKSGCAHTRTHMSARQSPMPRRWSTAIRAVAPIAASTAVREAASSRVRAKTATA